MPAPKKSKKNIEQEKEKEKEAKKAKKIEEFLLRSSGKSKNQNTEDPYAKKYNTRRRNRSNPNPPHTLSDHNTRAKKDCLKRGDSPPAFHGFESQESSDTSTEVVNTSLYHIIQNLEDLNSADKMTLNFDTKTGITAAWATQKDAYKAHLKQMDQLHKQFEEAVDLHIAEPDFETVKVAFNNLKAKREELENDEIEIEQYEPTVLNDGSTEMKTLGIQVASHNKSIEK